MQACWEEKAARGSTSTPAPRDAPQPGPTALMALTPLSAKPTFPLESDARAKD